MEKITIQVFISKNKIRRFYFFGTKVYVGTIVIIYENLIVTEKWRFYSSNMDLLKKKMVIKVPSIIKSRFNKNPESIISELITKILL